MPAGNDKSVRDLIVDKIKADKILNLKGFSCPIPLLKTKKALEQIKSGQILQIIVSDPGSRTYIPGLGRRNGNQYMGMTTDHKGLVSIFIRKG